jgi:hypothetical protein
MLFSFKIVLNVADEKYGVAKRVMEGSYTKHARAIGTLKMEQNHDVSRTVSISTAGAVL